MMIRALPGAVASCQLLGLLLCDSQRLPNFLTMLAVRSQDCSRPILEADFKFKRTSAVHSEHAGGFTARPLRNTVQRQD